MTIHQNKVVRYYLLTGIQDGKEFSYLQETLNLFFAWIAIIGKHRLSFRKDTFTAYTKDYLIKMCIISTFIYAIGKTGQCDSVWSRFIV